MRLLTFTHHDGDRIYIEASKVVWIRAHSCNRHPADGGIESGTDICLQGAHYVAVREPLSKVCDAIQVVYGYRSPVQV